MVEGGAAVLFGFSVADLVTGRDLVGGAVTEMTVVDEVLEVFDELRCARNESEDDERAERPSEGASDPTGHVRVYLARRREGVPEPEP